VTIGVHRDLPGIGEAHAVVRGVLQTGEAVTLLDVSGTSYSPLHVSNGVSFVRGDLQQQVSGTNVNLTGQHVIIGVPADSEPEFDEIQFAMPELETLLRRTRVWHPTGEIEKLGGYVPLVVVPVDDFAFEWQGFTIGFQQVRRFSMSTAFGDHAQTWFSVGKVTGRISISDAENLLNDLRLLAEISCGRHVGFGDIDGVNLDDRRPDRYQILSYLQRRSERSESERSWFSLGTFRPPSPRGPSMLSELQDEVQSRDADREQLIRRWLDWLNRANNRDLVKAFLDPFHSFDRPSTLAVYRSTVGVLEDACKSPRENPRVPKVTAEEIASRESAIALIESALVEEDASEWALGVLNGSRSGKGLGRQLGELIEFHKHRLTRLLRSNPNQHTDETQETTKTLARRIAGIRGSVSHGTVDVPNDFSWRTDQLVLIWLAIVFHELGYDDQIVEAFTHEKSHRTRWWDE